MNKLERVREEAYRVIKATLDIEKFDDVDSCWDIVSTLNDLQEQVDITDIEQVEKAEALLKTCENRLSRIASHIEGLYSRWDESLDSYIPE